MFVESNAQAMCGSAQATRKVLKQRVDPLKPCEKCSSDVRIRSSHAKSA